MERYNILLTKASEILTLQVSIVNSVSSQFISSKTEGLGYLRSSNQNRNFNKLKTILFCTEINVPLHA